MVGWIYLRPTPFPLSHNHISERQSCVAFISYCFLYYFRFCTLSPSSLPSSLPPYLPSSQFLQSPCSEAPMKQKQDSLWFVVAESCFSQVGQGGLTMRLLRFGLQWSCSVVDRVRVKRLQTFPFQLDHWNEREEQWWLMYGTQNEYVMQNKCNGTVLHTRVSPNKQEMLILEEGNKYTFY